MGPTPPCNQLPHPTTKAQSSAGAHLTAAPAHLLCMSTVYETRAEMLLNSLVVSLDILEKAASTSLGGEVVTVLQNLCFVIILFKKNGADRKMSPQCLGAHRKLPKQALFMISTNAACFRLRPVRNLPSSSKRHLPKQSYSSSLQYLSSGSFFMQLVSATDPLSSK